MTDRKKFIMLILFSIFFPLVIGSVCVLVNGNKISKTKPSGKTILVDNKNYSFEMDMENFISYVLMAQMDESEPEELLKAKSVIIRTYILYKMKDKAQIAPSRFRNGI
ncbi:MAG: SpoIID/LytB domain-containing protein [Eubacterium ventriosum]